MKGAAVHWSGEEGPVHACSRENNDPLAFVVVIVGGMGSLKGAFVGSLVVGMIDNYGKALVPELSYFTLFAPMILVLALKPTGLYGRA
jgi:branched-chain amino acid transport system permease protein